MEMRENCIIKHHYITFHPEYHPYHKSSPYSPPVQNFLVIIGPAGPPTPDATPHDPQKLRDFHRIIFTTDRLSKEPIYELMVKDREHFIMESIPKRYIMGIMCFLGMFQMYFARLVSFYDDIKIQFDESSPFLTRSRF